MELFGSVDIDADLTLPAADVCGHLLFSNPASVPGKTRALSVQVCHNSHGVADD